MVPILLAYLAPAIPVFPDLWTAVSSPDLDAFRRLTALPGGAAAIWAQVIAWDLLIGQWMYREAGRLGISALLMGPLLAFTILLSPFGPLVFLALRTAKRRRPDRKGLTVAVPGQATWAERRGSSRSGPWPG
ncbi:abscisic acid-deficient protein Aba4 family protein [Streptomyces roseoverticillatus]|uniref:abscisic acid-deficient protein Aba4 family protein n=1 Tax=Streptomyces roseoverticillatus TaxID=66429 RepID=UPI003F53F6C0